MWGRKQRNNSGNRIKMNKWKESKAPLYYPEKPGERVFMKENKQIKTISCFLKRQEKK